MTPFLRDDELLEMCKPLTQPAAMCRFLERLGIPFERRPNGWPLASRDAIAGRLAGHQDAIKRSGPDTAALLARLGKRRSKK
jgi:hypothetical protein